MLRAAGAIVTGAALLCAAPALAQQQGERDRSVGATAVDAATAPLSDLNIMSRDLHPALLRAQAAPYDLSYVAECPALREEIAIYEQVLGPDADAEQDDPGLLRRGLRLGGSVASSFIPFRGLVRQVSGASRRDAEREAAIYAGVARRSFLKGYAKGKGCLTTEEEALESAADVLGLELSPASGEGMDIAGD